MPVPTVSCDALLALKASLRTNNIRTLALCDKPQHRSLLTTGSTDAQFMKRPRFSQPTSAESFDDFFMATDAIRLRYFTPSGGDASSRVLINLRDRVIGAVQSACDWLHEVY